MRNPNREPSVQNKHARWIGKREHEYGQRKTFQQSRLTIYRATTATYCCISWWNEMFSVSLFCVHFLSFSFLFLLLLLSIDKVIIVFAQSYIVRSSWGESDGHHSNLFLYLIGILRAIIILTYDYVITVHWAGSNQLASSFSLFFCADNQTEFDSGTIGSFNRTFRRWKHKSF